MVLLVSGILLRLSLLKGRPVTEDEYGLTVRVELHIK